MSYPPPVNPGPPQPPPYRLGQVMPAPQKKKSSAGLIIGIVVAVFAVLCLGGGIIAAASGGGEKEPNKFDAAAAATPPAGSPPAAAPSGAAPTTAAPAAAPAPAAEKDQTFTGRGDKVVKLKLSEVAHFAVITHSGSSNFVVSAVDGGGQQLDLVVNEIGKYSGVRPLDFVETPAALKVEANGSWKIVVRTLDKAPMWPSAAKSGKGSAVVRVDPGVGGGLSAVKITHKGSSNFVVHAYGDFQELLVNEIGKYTGEVLLPDGSAAIVIEADGAWTMNPA